MDSFKINPKKFEFFVAREDSACPDCGNRDFAVDKGTDEVLCTNCGLQVSSVVRDVFWLLSGQKENTELSKPIQISKSGY